MFKGFYSLLAVIFIGILCFALFRSGLGYISSGGGSPIGIILFFGLPGTIIYGLYINFSNAYADHKEGIIRVIGRSDMAELNNKKREIKAKYGYPGVSHQNYLKCENEIREMEKNVRYGPRRD